MRAWWAGVGILLMVAGGSGVTQAAGIGQEPTGAGTSGTGRGDAPSAPSRPRVRRCMEGDKGCTVPPQTVYAPSPEYSKAGRKAKVQGVATMWVSISAEGEVQEVTLDKKLGYGLDEEAVKAVKKWKFRPASREGVPVAERVMLEVNFRLY
jgi:protein TonB